MDHNLNAQRDRLLFLHELRTEGMTGGAILWYYGLKAKKMNGYQFHRRHPIGDSIVDFVCLKLDLIIEIKGSLPDSNFAIYRKRVDDFEKLGYTVMTLSESEVIENTDKSIDQIRITVENLEKKKKLPH